MKMLRVQAEGGSMLSIWNIRVPQDGVLGVKG